MPGDGAGDALQESAGGNVPGGRFWALSSLESDLEDAPAVSLSPSSKYLSGSTETDVAGSSRATKRIEKRRKQREAAREWIATSSPAVSADRKSPSRRSWPGSRESPVMSPTIHLLEEEFDPSEWITVQRRKRREGSRSSRRRRCSWPAMKTTDHGGAPIFVDRGFSGNFKFDHLSGLGQIGRASGRERVFAVV